MNHALSRPRSETAPLRIGLALFVFLATLASGWHSVLTCRQLGPLAGIADEWFVLGAKLRVNGTLGLSRQEPSVMRAPGYPLFIAGLLVGFVPPPASVSLDAYNERGENAVYFAQAMLLATSAAALFLWLSRHLTIRYALLAACVYGLNPYTLVLAGLLHYDALHLLGVVLGCWALDPVFDGPEPRPSAPLVAGALWGAVTLVRSVTLALPVVVLGALVLRCRRVLPALRSAMLFTVGVSLVIAPWTLRNYLASGRLVAVNEQLWTNLWASTAKPVDTSASYYHWFDLFAGDFMPIYREATGEASYTYPTQVRRNHDLEAAFRRHALTNLRGQPEVYARNVLASFCAFNLRFNAVLIEAFRRVQPRGAQISQYWFLSGHPDAIGDGSSRLFSGFMLMQTLLALGGVAVAIGRRQVWLLAPAAVYLCFCAVHSLVYLDLMYYYVKLPFLCVFACCFMEWLDTWALKVPGLGPHVPAGATLAALLGGTCLILNLAVLWSR